MSLQHVAGVTRIPLRSLQLLESGDFEALPGDVFVRGFITAYANCLELDTDNIIDRYSRCEAAPRPQPLSVAETIEDNADDDPIASVPAFMQAVQPNKRVGVTFALILLLIVATLTISYFLRSTDSAGNGVTMLFSALG